MMYMVNSVCTKGKYFGQPSSDFVNQQHEPQCTIAVKSCFTTRCKSYWIKVIVTKLTSYSASIFIKAEICPVRIPLTHCRDVRRHTSCCIHGGFLPKTDSTALLCDGTCLKGFATKYGTGVGPMINRRNSAANAIEMEPFNQVQCLWRHTLRMKQEVPAIFAEADCLIRGSRKQSFCPIQW